MGSVNVTVRVDEEIKKDFDSFCENVGINITTAFNMFIKATLRTRELPFIVTDNPSQEQASLVRGKNDFRAAQEQSIINGTNNMTMDDIDAEISAYRQPSKIVE